MDPYGPFWPLLGVHIAKGDLGTVISTDISSSVRVESAQWTDGLDEIRVHVNAGRDDEAWISGARQDVLELLRAMLAAVEHSD